MNKRETYLAFGTPDFTDLEIDAVARVMRSGWVGMGKETIAFENELSEYIGAPEVVTVNSCTSALFLALLAEGVGPGDEVIVPSLTWCATANAALYLGAKPVFCDVDPLSMCVTPETVAAKLSDRTKAVIVVHYGGYAIDVEALRTELPSKISIIEDAAHAFGAKYSNGQRVGASGNSVCFSFYANKNLSTADGGAIALYDAEKANHLRSLRMSGMGSDAWSRYIRPSTAFVTGLTELGYKMNFTDLQAAIGRVQLERFDEMAEKRKCIALRYQERFAEAAISIPFQSQVFEERHARHLLVGCFGTKKTGKSRDQLLLALRDQNIGASIHYRPLHLQSLYNHDGSNSLPITESLAEIILTLPISARMTLNDVDYVFDHLVKLI
ncbi:DegT/DnrJ/EryC1/StrS family aminotransferase [Methylomonas methanica]|uniref:DegT/DnrJ/EryC1/StrS family aminotransferase n=1 Tax=Methylomonas methanica TaxID=421 RepID=UPI000B268ABE|nr:DegT/DnrJ/EryC1/StrS aminotransferase family protein [Methylomonas methanica]